jgi:hypothetical protein
MSDFNQQNFIDHCNQNQRDFDEVKGILNKIKDNHLAHLTESVNKIENTLIEVQTNQSWQLKFFWIIVSGVLGSIVVGVLGLIMK